MVRYLVMLANGVRDSEKIRQCLMLLPKELVGKHVLPGLYIRIGPDGLKHLLHSCSHCKQVLAYRRPRTLEDIRTHEKSETILYRQTQKVIPLTDNESDSVALRLWRAIGIYIYNTLPADLEEKIASQHFDQLSIDKLPKYCQEYMPVLSVRLLYDFRGLCVVQIADTSDNDIYHVCPVIPNIVCADAKTILLLGLVQSNRNIVPDSNQKYMDWVLKASDLFNRTVFQLDTYTEPIIYHQQGIYQQMLVDYLSHHVEPIPTYSTTHFDVYYIARNIVAKIGHMNTDIHERLCQNMNQSSVSLTSKFRCLITDRRLVNRFPVKKTWTQIYFRYGVRVIWICEEPTNSLPLSAYHVNRDSSAILMSMAHTLKNCVNTRDDAILFENLQLCFFKINEQGYIIFCGIEASTRIQHPSDVDKVSCHLQLQRSWYYFMIHIGFDEDLDYLQSLGYIAGDTTFQFVQSKMPDQLRLYGVDWDDTQTIVVTEQSMVAKNGPDRDTYKVINQSKLPSCNMNSELSIIQDRSYELIASGAEGSVFATTDCKHAIKINHNKSDPSHEADVNGLFRQHDASLGHYFVKAQCVHQVEITPSKTNFEFNTSSVIISAMFMDLIQGDPIASLITAQMTPEDVCDIFKSYTAQVIASFGLLHKTLKYVLTDFHLENVIARRQPSNNRRITVQLMKQQNLYREFQFDEGSYAIKFIDFSQIDKNPDITVLMRYSFIAIRHIIDNCKQKWSSHCDTFVTKLSDVIMSIRFSQPHWRYICILELLQSGKTILPEDIMFSFLTPDYSQIPFDAIQFNTVEVS